MNTEFVIEQIIKFSPEIADSIRSLTKQIGENYKELTDSDLKEIIHSPQSFLFVAEDVSTKQIAGMIFVMIYRIPYTKKAFMDNLVVDKAFRKKGIATRLLLRAVDVAREKQAEFFEFTSNPGRISGNSLYQKLGFQKRETNVYRLEL